jgi:hypothetical protein
VIYYKVFQGRKLIKKTHKHSTVIHHRYKNRSYLYKLVAVNSSGEESAPLFLHIVPKKKSKQCTKCPEFSVISPAVNTGEVGVFFSQSFTTNSCINSPIFTTNSLLPPGLTLFPDGVLSGIPTQAGTFQIIVTAMDARGCTVQSPTYNLIITCASITFTTQIVNPSCNGLSNGSLTIIASNDAPPLYYSIDGGVIFQASNVFNNLAAGPYTIVIKDANGCTAQGSATLINPEMLAFTTTIVNPLCNGQSNGSITFQVTGGTQPYLFSINGGASFQSSNVFSGLAASTYPLIAQDANGCLTTGSATLTNPLELSFTTQPVNPLCNGINNGSITFTASGGTPPYLFSINGGSSFQTSNIFTDLFAGTYFLEVMDVNQCFVSGSTMLTNPSPITFTTTITNICMMQSSPQNSGSITINASGGTGSFTYSDDGGATFQPSNTFSNLSANTYSLVVQDSNGCTSSGMATVTQSTAPTLSIMGGVCSAGSCTVTLVASGGTPPFTYTITPPSVVGPPISNNTGFFPDLQCFVLYQTEVIDSNGCRGSAGPFLCD